ncbi:hypothetical protein DFR74_110223 [Nocardia puris]|uniref:Gp19/Gp15/Gp42-like protein n=2 Tax=Nocardia puris TaxID=208602 RepID=A0A366DD33_9NOCA|nr:hypothetical protein DFR74_110223 [Nocardia puris]
MYATLDDVRNRYEGEISGQEAEWVTARLADADALLRAMVPALADGPEAVAPLMAQNARRVIVDAVLRVLRNPAGLTEQSVGPFRVRYDTGENYSATVYFTGDELSVFAPPRRRFGVVGVRVGRWIAWP